MSTIHPLAAALALGTLAQANATSAEELTIGMITTLSGPGALR